MSLIKIPDDLFEALLARFPSFTKEAQQLLTESAVGCRFLGVTLSQPLSPDELRLRMTILLGVVLGLKKPTTIPPAELWQMLTEKNTGPSETADIRRLFQNLYAHTVTRPLCFIENTLWHAEPSAKTKEVVTRLSEHLRTQLHSPRPAFDCIEMYFRAISDTTSITELSRKCLYSIDVFEQVSDEERAARAAAVPSELVLDGTIPENRIRVIQYLYRNGFADFRRGDQVLTEYEVFQWLVDRGYLSEMPSALLDSAVPGSSAASPDAAVELVSFELRIPYNKPTAMRYTQWEGMERVYTATDVHPELKARLESAIDRRDATAIRNLTEELDHHDSVTFDDEPTYEVNDGDAYEDDDAEEDEYDYEYGRARME